MLGVCSSLIDVGSSNEAVGSHNQGMFMVTGC